MERFSLIEKPISWWIFWKIARRKPLLNGLGNTLVWKSSAEIVRETTNEGQLMALHKPSKP